MGSPFTESNITVVSPVLVMRSRQSVPKLDISMSPLLAKARPFGNVPSTNFWASSSELWKSSAEWDCVIIVWFPFASILTTPPLASADHNVPSFSAKIHSGRCKPSPINLKSSFFRKNPVWGQRFFDEISKCSMGINLSRGSPIKHYSSDRISSLLGNGLLTFIHEDYEYNDFLNKNEIVTYKNIKDLNKKILFFKKNNKKLKIIARNGYNKAHQIFNNKLIANFIVKKTFNIKTNSKIAWMNG